MMKFFASGQEQTGGDILPLQVLAFDLEDSDHSGKNHNQTENLQNLSRIYSKNRPFHDGRGIMERAVCFARYSSSTFCASGEI